MKTRRYPTFIYIQTFCLLLFFIASNIHNLICLYSPIAWYMGGMFCCYGPESASFNEIEFEPSDNRIGSWYLARIFSVIFASFAVYN